ncbi:insulinase family protein [Cereibacter sphaeroides]|uniref:M16 family metallopeptidase n=1 Tax=Cereibacter sphaeroides TaxID=1063 RepID=UPI000E5C0F90|nr:pitrilysin family protein [Cereibacter sphaeroides]RHZ98458.1 insulinase family protein [Cereibacter sphaeroides]
MMLRLAAALILFALPVRADVQIQDVTSPGGIHAWLVESHELPFTALEIRFRGGTSLDAEGARGAVNLMTGLLEEGAGDLDAQGFARARDGLAANFSFRPSTDAVAVSARFLTENRDEAVDLLRLALVEPRFDADAIDRVRGQVLSGLASDAKDPNHISGQVFDAQAFGDHPYGSDGSGTPESVQGLTREQVVAAHRAALARDRIYVAAAGDIDAGSLGLLLDRLLGDLPAQGAPMPPRADWKLDGGVTVVDFPTPQASVRFGQTGIERDDPDFFPAYVLNEILGGGRFGSRLMTEVREKRGLTYGIGSYLLPMDHAETMIGAFASSNATVGQAIDLVREEWRRTAAEGVTAEELEATKTYLTGSYPLRFDGNGPIASILVGMQMEGLPIDYPVTRNEKIEAVTLEDVKRVAQSLLKPEALHFVVVGQPEGVASDG